MSKFLWAIELADEENDAILPGLLRPPSSQL